MSENSVEYSELIAHTSDIVVAHISRNSVSTNELPEFIETVFNTLSGLGAPAAEVEAGRKPETLDNLLRIRGDLDSSQSGDPKLLRLLRGFREQLEHHKGSGLSDR
jgi:hypothetical protein